MERFSTYFIVGVVGQSVVGQHFRSIDVLMFYTISISINSIDTLLLSSNLVTVQCM